MSPAHALAVAAAFVWLGMVLAISFVEAPLKFRAPGVTLQLGLGIGRVVFRALNACELVLAVAVALAMIITWPAATAAAALVIAIAVLAVQLVLVRPRLARRSAAVLAGRDAPRSRAHLAYVAAEAVKVVALAVGGISLLVIG